MDDFKHCLAVPFLHLHVLQLISPPVSLRHSNPEIPYLARARRLQAARKVQIELEEEQNRILKSRSFHFLDRPPEISFLVLTNCIELPGMYSSLVLVSPCCQQLTFHALLPHIPIKLITPEQIRSFGLLLCRRPKLATLVHNSWVTPYKEDLLRPCVDIIVRNVAIRNHFLRKSSVISIVRICPYFRQAPGYGQLEVFWPLLTV